MSPLNKPELSTALFVIIVSPSLVGTFNFDAGHDPAVQYATDHYRIHGYQRGASPNTVHLTILIRVAKSMRRVRWRLRGRKG